MAHRLTEGAGTVWWFAHLTREEQIDLGRAVYGAVVALQHFWDAQTRLTDKYGEVQEAEPPFAAPESILTNLGLLHAVPEDEEGRERLYDEKDFIEFARAAITGWFGVDHVSDECEDG